MMILNLRATTEAPDPHAIYGANIAKFALNSQSSRLLLRNCRRNGQFDIPKEALRRAATMSALRQALRRSCRLQDLLSSRSFLPVESGLPGVLPAAFQQPKSITSSSATCASVHIEDELYCRQRQLLVLGNRVPVLAPDSWVAPNAVIIGDVDIFDQVMYWVSSSELKSKA